MKKGIGLLITALLIVSMLAFIYTPATSAAPTIITDTYISDDSGATLAMDDAINPSTGMPWYGPTTWSGSLYAWGPTDGTGWFWNQYLHPSGYKTELLGSGANWIWKPTGTTGQTLPDGRTVYKITSAEAVTGDIVKFKRSFNIPSAAFNLKGTLLIGTDNAFYLYVNKGFTGTPFGQGNFYDGYNYANFRNPTTGFPIEGSVELPGTPPYPWSTIHSYDISSELTTGTNNLEIVGINEYSTPSTPGTPESNPAGVIYRLTVQYELRTLSKTLHKKVKVIPAPVQFWRMFIGGVTDVIVSDPPEWPEGVALMRDYAVLREEGPIPLELLTWAGTEHLPWTRIDYDKPYILLPGEVAEYNIYTDERTTAVLVRYTVAWQSTPDVIEAHFVNEAILENQSPQVIVGQLSNFDVHNDYHEPVDNFELELYGIQPSDIVAWFPGWGTPPQINPLPGGTEIIWMDLAHPVQPCQWQHFGLHLKPGVIATGVKAYWTQWPSAELGDVIHVRLEVIVPPGETVKIVDMLPPDLGYIQGSFSVNGVPATPTVDRNVISYTITASGTVLIEFDAKVTSAYWEDRTVTNKAIATWYDKLGNMVYEKEATADFTIHAFEELHKQVSRIDWPKYHYDLSLSGYTTSTAPNTNATLWTYQTGGPVYSSPAIVNGKVYIGSEDGNLYKLDGETGALLWKYPTGSAIKSSPAVEGGKVYFLSTNGKMYALNAASGSLVWSLFIDSGFVPWSSPAVHDGKVYIGASNGTIYALNAATGAVVWKTIVGGSPNGPITVANKKVYSGTHSGNPTLIALNEANGLMVWQYLHPGGGFVNSNGAAVVDGDGDGNLDVYFGVVVFGGVGQAIALNEANGAVKWTYTFRPITGAGPGPKGPGWSTSTPAVHNGKVYIGSDDQYVYALDAGTGAWVWDFQTQATVWTAPAVADGKVFVGSNDHLVYALDETTGALVWSYNTSLSRIEGSPAVADGKVFIGNENGKVYAFGPSLLVVKVNTNVQWKHMIEVTNPFSYTMTNVVITDRFGAEIEIDPPFPYSITHGTATYWFKGASDKIFLEWTIGNLLPGETARLILLISTDYNPGKGDCNEDDLVNLLDSGGVSAHWYSPPAPPGPLGYHPNADYNNDSRVDIFDAAMVNILWIQKTKGHQEYTEPGIYALNSGATLKFIDPEQNVQLSAVTAPIYVTAVPAEDP